MGKLSGKDGRIKLGTAVALATPGAVITSGVCTVTTASAHGLVAGMFVLLKGVTGMADLNNLGKGFIVASAPTTTTFTVTLTSSQTWTSGGTAQRIIPITDWSIDGSIETGDATDSESGAFKDKIVAGHKDWKGSYSGLDYDGAGLPPWGDILAAELDIDGTNYYSGTAIFNGWKSDVKVVGANAVTQSGTFEGTGVLTKTKTVS
jgi:hypothetical protein